MQVGDRLDTDIVFGNSNGALSCLVFSGVTTPASRLSSVLFPLPLGPSTKSRSPSATLSESSVNTGGPPDCQLKERLEIWMAGKGGIGACFYEAEESCIADVREL